MYDVQIFIAHKSRVNYACDQNKTILGIVTPTMGRKIYYLILIEITLTCRVSH